MDNTLPGGGYQPQGVGVGIPAGITMPRTQPTQQQSPVPIAQAQELRDGLFEELQRTRAADLTTARRQLNNRPTAKMRTKLKKAEQCLLWLDQWLRQQQQTSRFTLQAAASDLFTTPGPAVLPPPIVQPVVDTDTPAGYDRVYNADWVYADDMVRCNAADTWRRPVSNQTGQNTYDLDVARRVRG